MQRESEYIIQESTNKVKETDIYVIVDVIFCGEKTNLHNSRVNNSSHCGWKHGTQSVCRVYVHTLMDDWEVKVTKRSIFWVNRPKIVAFDSAKLHLQQQSKT